MSTFLPKQTLNSKSIATLLFSISALLPPLSWGAQSPSSNNAKKEKKFQPSLKTKGPIKKIVHQVKKNQPLKKVIQPTRPQKTKIKIKGLRDLSESKALLLLGNITDHIVANAPSSSRADDVAFLLEQKLRKSGYPEAEVEWSLPANNSSILLTVNQGPTRNMGAIEVVGVTEDLIPKISAYFKTQPSSVKILSNETVPFIPDNVEKSVINATSFLHSEGYWKAKVELSDKNFHNDTGLVDLQVKVTSGPRYLLGPISLQASSPLPLAPLREKLAEFKEQIANTHNILKAHTVAIQYFTQQGYALTTIEMDQELVGKHALLIFRIKPNKQFRIRKVNITGLKLTKPAVIDKLFSKAKGQLYSQEKLSKIQKKLIATGAFESVVPNTQINEDNTIDLTLRMKEGKSKSVSGYAGAGSFEGFILGVGYHDNNFRGKLHSLSISTEFSGLGLLGRASLTNPLFRGSTKQSLTYNAFILSHKFDGYSKYEAGLGIELAWDITDHYSLRFYGEALAAATRSNGLPDDALGLQDYRVLRTGITQKLDYRNDPLSPTKGFHGELTVEAGLVSNSSTSLPYSRALLNTSYRQPIDDFQYLVFTGKSGAIFNNNPDDFPVDLRFFTGGSNSIRSFPQREMGPSANGNYRGGQAFWETSIEYNRKITGPVWTNIFVDAGSLSALTGDLFSSDVHLAAGLGFWLDLPIGPVRAEYGYNLNRKKGEPAGSFHFTIGVRF